MVMKKTITEASRKGLANIGEMNRKVFWNPSRSQLEELLKKSGDLRGGAYHDGQGWHIAFWPAANLTHYSFYNELGSREGVQLTRYFSLRVGRSITYLKEINDWRHAEVHQSDDMYFSVFPEANINDIQQDAYLKKLFPSVQSRGRERRSQAEEEQFNKEIWDSGITEMVHPTFDYKQACRNPSPNRLLSMIKKAKHHDLRGIYDGADLYFWDASLGTHDSVSHAIGVAYDYRNRLHVDVVYGAIEMTWDEGVPKNLIQDHYGAAGQFKDPQKFEFDSSLNETNGAWKDPTRLGLMGKLSKAKHKNVARRKHIIAKAVAHLSEATPVKDGARGPVQFPMWKNPTRSSLQQLANHGDLRGVVSKQGDIYVWKAMDKDHAHVQLFVMGGFDNTEFTFYITSPHEKNRHKEDAEIWAKMWSIKLGQLEMFMYGVNGLTRGEPVGNAFDAYPRFKKLIGAGALVEAKRKKRRKRRQVGGPVEGGMDTGMIVMGEAEKLYYVQPDGTWSPIDGRGVGLTKNEVEAEGGEIVEGVIKLGSRSSPGLQAFMADYVENTSEHPINHRARLLNNAAMEVSAFDGMIHISDILALQPGGGRAALELLCNLADKHGVKMSLTAKSYDTQRATLDTGQLKAWYERHGFVEDEDTFGDDDEGYDMIRWPQGLQEAIVVNDGRQWGDRVSKNPTRRSLEALTKTWGDIRGSVSDDGDVYIWPAASNTHGSAGLMASIRSSEGEVVFRNDIDFYVFANAKSIARLANINGLDPNIRQADPNQSLDWAIVSETHLFPLGDGVISISDFKRLEDYTRFPKMARLLKPGLTESVAPSRLGDLITVKLKDEDADFWVVRRGSLETVGKPVREYNPEHYGIKVTRTDLMLPDYLFYMLQYIHMQGVFKRVAKGTLKLVNITADQLKAIPIGQKQLTEGVMTNEAGKPLVVYHGTNQTFDEFSKSRGGLSTGPQAGARHGFFFTSDPDEAQEYAEHAGRRVVANINTFEKETERLRREQERLEKVAERSGREEDWRAYEVAYQAWEDYEINATQEDPNTGVNVIAAHLILNNPLVVNFNGSIKSEHGVIEDVVQKAVDDGHDGVIMRNIWDSPVGGRTSDHYVVFSAKQIKRVPFDQKQLDENRASLGRGDHSIVKFGDIELIAKIGEWRDENEVNRIAIRKNGDQVGMFSFEQPKDGKVNGHLAFQSGHRGGKIGVQLYRAIQWFMAERGLKLVPSHMITDGPYKIWQIIDPDAVKTYVKRSKFDDHHGYIWAEPDFKSSLIREQVEKLEEVNEISPFDDNLNQHRKREMWGDIVKQSSSDGKIKGFKVLLNDDPNGKQFVLMDGKEPIGKVSLQKDAARQYTVKHIWFEPRVRGQGLGYAMYEYLLNKGYNIASDYDQTQLSKSIWKRLVQRHDVREVLPHEVYSEERVTPENFEQFYGKHSTNFKRMVALSPLREAKVEDDGEGYWVLPDGNLIYCSYEEGKAQHHIDVARKHFPNGGQPEAYEKGWVRYSRSNVSVAINYRKDVAPASSLRKVMRALATVPDQFELIGRTLPMEVYIEYDRGEWKRCTKREAIQQLQADAQSAPKTLKEFNMSATDFPDISCFIKDDGDVIPVKRNDRLHHSDIAAQNGFKGGPGIAVSKALEAGWIRVYCHPRSQALNLEWNITKKSRVAMKKLYAIVQQALPHGSYMIEMQTGPMSWKHEIFDGPEGQKKCLAFIRSQMGGPSGNGLREAVVDTLGRFKNPVYQNPSRLEYKKLVSKLMVPNEPDAIRALLDPDTGNIYLWDGYFAAHGALKDRYKLPKAFHLVINKGRVTVLTLWRCERDGYSRKQVHDMVTGNQHLKNILGDVKIMIQEGKTETIAAQNWGGLPIDLKVIWNPTLQQLTSLFDSSKDDFVRGLIHGKDIVVWDAYQTEHADAAKALGIELEPRRLNRFFIHRYAEKDHRIGPDRVAHLLSKVPALARLGRTGAYRFGGPDHALGEERAPVF